MACVVVMWQACNPDPASRSSPDPDGAWGPPLPVRPRHVLADRGSAAVRLRLDGEAVEHDGGGGSASSAVKGVGVLVVYGDKYFGDAGGVGEAPSSPIR